VSKEEEQGTKKDPRKQNARRVKNQVAYIGAEGMEDKPTQRDNEKNGP